MSTNSDRNASTNQEDNSHVEAQSPTTPTSAHPFQNSKNLLVLIPDRIDVEEESRLYDELLDSADSDVTYYQESPLPQSPIETAPSIFSNDIWLGDNSGESLAFARNVQVSGWTSVGDKRGGAYIVYDCAISTKEGTVIHALKRYSSFAELYARLRGTLPKHQQRFIPTLPPKSPLAKFRPTFLDRRRRLLEHWLGSVLLHPDIGGCKACRDWVME
ncbi:hypothetical protein C8Q75DRAFT_769970 [Abortiporus biennis]|nr:hypothetical protein C8Q75DRAFT_769970 [Abortiporus biennis]